jgi:pimeloyl-ACP methyl ester carboxylesterase
VHLAFEYYEDGYYKIMYMNNTTGDWSSMYEIASGINGSGCHNPSISIDRDGNWHIVYTKYIELGANVDEEYLIYINSISNAPITIPISKKGETGDASITVDSNGGVHLAFEYWEDGYYKIMYMNNTSLPVILVHGWRGAPNVWDKLIKKLDDEKIIHYEYDFSPATGDIQTYAKNLQNFIEEKKIDLKDKYSYTGKLDIVCFSMGALVSRYYMEVLKDSEDIRQWIGIAPVSQGAAMANRESALWMFGPLRLFLNIVFPDLWPSGAIVEMRTNSDIVKKLKTSPYVKYRVLAGINSNKITSGDWRSQNGKTLVMIKDSKEKEHIASTYLGDGMVALEQSVFPGVFSIDCFEGLIHNDLPKDDSVIYKVIQYLKDPYRQGTYTLDNYLKDDPKSFDFKTTSKDIKDVSYKDEQKSISCIIDKSIGKTGANISWMGKNQANAGVNKATFGVVWARPESNLNLVLNSPNGTIMQEGVSPVVEYAKDSTGIIYTIDSPESGEWTAKIQAINVPTEGEPYIFQALYSSSLQMDLITTDGKNLYNPGEKVTLVASLTEQETPITSASVITEIMRPDSITEKVTLYDDGSHSDVLANDGNYTNAYSLPILGKYEVTAYANGMNERVFERVAYLDIYAVGITTNINENKKKTIPTRSELKQNYPNPFNPNTTIEYDLPKTTNVILEIYNILGQRIRTLVNQIQAQGMYSIQWNGKTDEGLSVSSGLYLYRLQTGNFVETKKMIYLK